MRTFLLGVVVVLGCALSACSTERSTLEVHVITGLVPGPEFRIVETELLDGSSSSATRVLQTHEAIAHHGMDFAHGQRVAAFELAHGAYRVRVRLMSSNGNFLVDRVIAIDVNRDFVLPVHITRDCVGVICPAPGGSAAFTTCFSGQCVDPRCSPTSPEFCPEIVFCNEVSECSPVAACAEQACVEGVCTPSSIEGSCESTEWCNPDLGAGCEPFTPVPEPGIVCGTICLVEGELCRFGYWDCTVPSAPVCENLQARPVGYACELERVCNAEAECAVPVLEVPGIVVTPMDGLVTNEAGSVATFAITLATRPSASVTIALSSSNTDEGTVDPSSVTLTADDWDVAHMVSVTGVDDLIADGNASYTIVTAAAVSEDANYAGLDAADVSVINSDDETPGVTVSRTSGLSTSESGATDSFDITLNAAPVSNVTIMLASDNALEASVSPTSLTFTPSDYAMPHTVTVTGVDELIRDGDQAFLIVTSATASSDDVYNALEVPDVSGINVDDDVASVIVTPTAGLLTTEVGGTASFSLVLSSEPADNVAVSLSSSNAAEGSIAPSMIVFTPSDWSTPQSVTITGLDDGIVDGRISYSIITAPASSTDPYYSGFDAEDVSVANQGVIPREYVKASNTDGSDFFGYVAVSADGSTMAVGANGESSAATGIGGDQNDDSMASSGAVFIYVRSGSTWVQQAYIKASNTNASDNFGVDVSLSADGNTLAVGANYESSNATGVNGDQSNNAGTWSGAVYVFTRAGTTWSQEAYLKASNTGNLDYFGRSVDLAADGNTLAVSTNEEDSNATGINGDQSNNGASASGAVYVFARSSGVWTQQAYVKASNTAVNDWFGYAMDLADDGNTLAVGAYEEDSNATGINGDQSNNSANAAGAVYVFTRAGVVWSQQAYVKASNAGAGDRFSSSIALSADGNTMAVGAHYESSNARGIGGDESNNSTSNAGAAYVFTRTASVWTQEAYIKPSNTQSNGLFGYSIAISADGNTLVVGQAGDASNATGIDGDQSNTSVPFAGAVFLFTRVAGTWTQGSYIKAPSSDAYDFFGGSLSLSGDGHLLVVGSPQEDSAAVNIDGSSSDNSATNAGAVFLYRL